MSIYIQKDKEKDKNKDKEKEKILKISQSPMNNSLTKQMYSFTREIRFRNGRNGR
jgi:hypothetical protein